MPVLLVIPFLRVPGKILQNVWYLKDRELDRWQHFEVTYLSCVPASWYLFPPNLSDFKGGKCSCSWNSGFPWVVRSWSPGCRHRFLTRGSWRTQEGLLGELLVFMNFLKLCKTLDYVHFIDRFGFWKKSVTPPKLIPLLKRCMISSQLTGTHGA